MRDALAPDHVLRPARCIRALYADILAILGLIGLSLALFGPHLLGLTTFVGNSDRLHSFLSMRDMAVTAWQAGRPVPAWTDAMLLGIPVYGFHWMALGLDPFSPIVALFPEHEVFRVTGVITALHHATGVVAAYLFMRTTVRQPFAAAVGAALYGCSFLAIHRISQFDSTFAVLIILPLGMLLVRTLRAGRTAPTFLGLTASVAAIVGFTFLQEGMYALLFLGLYACFRCAVTRTWRPAVVMAAAGVAGVLLTIPRLVTVFEDFRELSRSSSMQSTCPCELLRWFDDGIFGRFPSEAAALGNALNLHEGFQLHTSVFAALAGVALLLWAGARSFIGRRFGMQQSVYLNDPDLPFFALVVAMTAAIVLSDVVSHLIYVAFFRVDFSHARIIVVALLPLCTLAAVFVHELFGQCETSEPPVGLRHATALVVGGGGAVVSLWLLDQSTPAMALALFGPVQSLALGMTYRPATSELARVALSGGLFFGVLALCWLARHVDLRRVAGSLRPGWRTDTGTPALGRLVPAYLLGCLMAAQAFGYAFFQLNGGHTQTYPVPFAANNYFTPPAGVLVPPGPVARQAVRARLETDVYRAVTVSAPDGYPTYGWASERGYASFVAQFWQLRLANGYGVLSRRGAELPWPPANRTLRAISFTDQHSLPWSLLAFLNVKYAIVASPSLIFNVPADVARAGADAGPGDLTILENPLPVVPRAFFAAAVSPRILPTPPAPGLLAPPTGISFIATKEQGIHIAWHSGPTDATYQISSRQLSPVAAATDTLLGTTVRGATGFLDTVVAPGGTYEYRLRACDAGGCSDLSESLIASVAVGSVAEPQLLDATPQSGTGLLVTWEPADSAATVRIEVRATTGPVVGVAVDVPPGIQSHIVRGLRPLGAYEVRLRACTPAGCSPHTPARIVSMPGLLTADDLDGVVPADPARESIVEGLASQRAFGSAAGSIDALYQGDRIVLTVEPSAAERFLVVNELYHPNWHAYARDAAGGAALTELVVWPTNIVMRGVLVPPGVSQIEMRFEPFLLSRMALLCVAGGLLCTRVGWLAFRRLDGAGG